MRVAIIGSGIAGLACADVLHDSAISSVLFDKGRCVGGRMSTRRIDTPEGTVAVDHGAQYFTARHSLFRAQVDAWARLGLAARWNEAGPEAWVGSPTMTAPIKAMASRHTVNLQHHVDGLVHTGGVWWVRGQTASHGPFDRVVIALPAEQAAPFLGMYDLSMARYAIEARSQPCWTAMVAFDRRLEISENMIRDRGIIGWACRNSAKPGRDGPEAWVVQGSGTWSAANLEIEAECAAQTLLAALLDQCRAYVSPDALSVTAHRWRYAMTRGTDKGALWNETLGLGACGDWLLGPRVESAWMSGRLLGERIRESHR